MAFILYFATVAVILLLVHRFVRRLSLASAIVIVAIPLGITGYALITDSVYGPIDYPYQTEPLAALGPLHGVGLAHNASATDIYSQFIPWRRAVQLSYQRGEWPLWNPYNHCGHLMAASLQSAPYSPFTLLAILLPVAVSFSFTAAMSLFLAALGAFLFARELDCSEASALVAAAGWGLAAITVLYSLTPMGMATSLAPLLFLGARRVVWTPDVASGALLTTVLTLSLLIGHPESLFLNVAVASAYAIFELIRRRAAPWRSLAAAMIAGAIALLLCAIQLLPFFEAMPHSGEYEFKEAIWASSERAVTWDRALASLATDLFPFLQVRRWIEPDFGYINAETATAGSIILALAIYAIWRRRSAETWFFAIVAIFCTAAGNRWSLVVDLLQALPLFDIVHHERLNFQAALALSILAALGVEEMIRRADFRAAMITMAIVLIVLTAGTLWLQANVKLAFDPADWGTYKIFAELFFLGLAALVPKRRALLLAMIVAQRFISEGGTFKTFESEVAYPRVAILEPLEKMKEPFRVVGASFALIPATNIYYGLEDPRGFEALTLGGFVHTWKLWCQHQPVWFNRADDLTRPFLSFLNVRFAIQSDTAPVPPGWRRVAMQRGAQLIENERVIERAFIPRRVAVGDLTNEEVANRMMNVEDFRQIAWITEKGAKEHERDNGPGTVVLKKRRLGGEHVLDATMQRDGWIVISDSDWPGWRAYVDGRRVRTQRANAAFLGVYVPAGRHEVRVVYWPDSFVRGRAISFATLIALAIFAVFWSRHN